jgi:hypothetical protein
MVDLTIVAADVGMTTVSPSLKTVTYGEAVDEGEAVYLKSSDGKYWLADASSTGTLETSTVAGVAITPGIADERGSIVTQGDFECGAATTEASVYVASPANAGGIAPVADLTTSNDWLTIIGFGLAGTNVMRVAITVTGLQVP